MCSPRAYPGRGYLTASTLTLSGRRSRPLQKKVGQRRLPPPLPQFTSALRTAVNRVQRKTICSNRQARYSLRKMSLHIRRSPLWTLKLLLADLMDKMEQARNTKNAVPKMRPSRSWSTKQARTVMADTSRTVPRTVGRRALTRLLRANVRVERPGAAKARAADNEMQGGAGLCRGGSDSKLG